VVHRTPTAPSGDPTDPQQITERFTLVSQTTQPLAEKVCKTCETLKPISEFYLRKQGRKFVRRNTCRDCQIHKQRKKATGASEEDYQRLLVAQGFKCRICSSSTNGSKAKFAVDHCHTTGAIRGLLCCSCNMALGLFSDDPLRLSRAITYLAESRDNVGAR